MSARGPAVLLLAAIVPALGACEPYRIEYHKRPAWYHRMSDRPLPERMEKDDGTVVLFNVEPGAGDPGETKQPAEPFRIRKELDDGTVVLHAIMPEHVVANTLNCLRAEEYDLLWDQVIAEETRMAYEAQGQGREEFVDFCREHRNELARTLNRMLMGFRSNDVVVEGTSDGYTVVRFWPHVGQQFRFKQLTITQEGFEQKLVLIY